MSLIVRQLTISRQHYLFVDFCAIHDLYVLFASKICLPFAFSVAICQRIHAPWQSFRKLV